MNAIANLLQSTCQDVGRRLDREGGGLQCHAERGWASAAPHGCILNGSFLDMAGHKARGR